jgi:N-formylglutamate amidohydrolase
MTSDAFHLRSPAHCTTCAIFASPHSGRSYPKTFLKQTILGDLSVRSSEDAYVDRLIAAAPDLGAQSILATMPRAWLDLNRAEDELDPAVISGAPRQSHNPRVASGLGVIPRVVANGRAIYRGKLPLSEAQTRLHKYWRPYHAQLRAMIGSTKARFGQAILLDMHSMPHEAIASLRDPQGCRPDVVLGDRFGAACGAQIMDQIEAAFAAEGLTCARNTPFAGAYITQAYGRPAQNVHVVQVELDRRLYMDEATVQPHAGFDDFAARLTRVMGEIADIGRPAVSLAAE